MGCVCVFAVGGGLGGGFILANPYSKNLSAVKVSRLEIHTVQRMGMYSSFYLLVVIEYLARKTKQQW